ncbi:MAG: SDR family oxidoreductase, partial [Bacteroidales bacterium]|nr:SDR family oxidoreductase [Bacteroidales bacterium]
GHEVVCAVRDHRRFDSSRFRVTGSGLHVTGYGLSVIEVDFLDRQSLEAIPDDIDAAYYLVHSMSSSIGDFEELEKRSAENFRDRINQTKARQVIYLSGIINSEELSKHLTSRKAVEDILKSGRYELTTLRAGIIVGSGSASFEIIRDLVEKLPAMIAPRWLNTRSQPVAISNVIQFLNGVLLKEETFGRSFDIGGPEILTYKEMLMGFARARGLRRNIWVVPVMTPKLSSYWLYFITSTSYKLAVNLVDSMKVEIVCSENDLAGMLNIELIRYEDAVRMAFDKIEQHDVLSSWTDALSGDTLSQGISTLINVPEHGCFKDMQKRRVNNEQAVLDKIWAIGGKSGWYYGNWLWEIRGLLDKMVGGVGLRRGRRDDRNLVAGDALDFWRVLYADRSEKRLLLYAEMKLPGEAWLEFKIENNMLVQTATFRPLGLWGRLYWYSVLPFHGFIFRGMIGNIVKNKN